MRAFFFDAHHHFRFSQPPPLSQLSQLSPTTNTNQGFPVAHIQLPLSFQTVPTTSSSVLSAAGGELVASNFSGGVTIKGAGVEVEVSFFFFSTVVVFLLLLPTPFLLLLPPPFLSLCANR